MSTLNVDTGVFSSGLVATPSITFEGDVNTGLYSPAADTLAFTTAGKRRLNIVSDGSIEVRDPGGTNNIILNDPDTGYSVRINGIENNSGANNVGVFADFTISDSGVDSGYGFISDFTVPASQTMNLLYGFDARGSAYGAGATVATVMGFRAASNLDQGATNTFGFRGQIASASGVYNLYMDGTADNYLGGDLLVGKTSSGIGTVGIEATTDGILAVTRDSDPPIVANRETNDGSVILIRQDNTTEGSISVSGTTVTYGGGHLARWSRLPDESRPEIYKGSVLHNLDEMVVWEGEDNEQLNKTQLCSEYKCKRVAGLFDHWDYDDDEYNDFYVAECGDFIVRVAPGVTVENGDLLTSSDVEGCAVPQDDDLVHSYTIAKVTSITHAFDYPDGSYAVPCTITQ